MGCQSALKAAHAQKWSNRNHILHKQQPVMVKDAQFTQQYDLGHADLPPASRALLSRTWAAISAITTPGKALMAPLAPRSATTSPRGTPQICNSRMELYGHLGHRTPPHRYGRVKAKNQNTTRGRAVLPPRYITTA